ncbi:MAG: hypothetical protein NVSMB30_01610 [Hymenobacter sp.]
MKAFYLCCALLSSLLAGPVLAQTDTILRTNGDEVRGRVLTITPVDLTYVSADPTKPAGADTVRLPAASVLLVRYANGTKEIISATAAALTPPATPAASLLPGLSAPERYQCGRADALKQYRPRGVFVGTLGSTLLLGPMVGTFAGLTSAAILSSTRVNDRNLLASAPALLSDPSYASGYRQQANRTKRQNAWGGYGTGMGIYAAVVIMALAALSH